MKIYFFKLLWSKKNLKQKNVTIKNDRDLKLFEITLHMYIHIDVYSLSEKYSTTI